MRPKNRIVRTLQGGYVVRRGRPVCGNCGMVNTVSQSGYCVNCHAAAGER